jgi:hypothetical protein
LRRSQSLLVQALCWWLSAALRAAPPSPARPPQRHNPTQPLMGHPSLPQTNDA